MVIASSAPESRTLPAKVTCHSDDTFDEVWRRIFRSIPLSDKALTLNVDSQLEMNYAHQVSSNITPDEVHGLLMSASRERSLLVVIDEFDQIEDAQEQKRFASVIKALSDDGVDATVVLVGVADSVNDMLTGHQSVERALLQIQMPRMSPSELVEIVDNGYARSEMRAVDGAATHIAKISQGLPHYTHSLALHAGRNALDDRRDFVTMEDVKASLLPTIEAAQESIKTAYHKATFSSQRSSLFRQVLLASAIAASDDLGPYF